MSNFNYKWYLKDNYKVEGIEKNNLNVFSTFACGGGSTMGYKLAGYNVLGCNEIDPKIIEVYKKNHNPKYAFLGDIRDFRKKEDLPEELYNLDILDGSPPCSSFSLAGSREDAWGKEKVFREGQASQVLDNLFFEYLELVNKLKPKVAVAENVKGMLIGNAKAYTKKILETYDRIGYKVKLFLLNGATMGVPQKRERVFFIAHRKDVNFPELKFEFNERSIIFNEYKENIDIKNITDREYNIWKQRNKNDLNFGDTLKRIGQKYSNFTIRYIYTNKTPNTIIAHDNNILYDIPRHMTKNELCQTGSYPLDYDFLKIKPHYLIGMSVPPLMTAQIAYQIYLQWFNNKKITNYDNTKTIR